MNQGELKDIAIACAKRIEDGVFSDDPYKHLVVDEFLPDSLAQACMEAFPSSQESVWESESDKDIEIKSRTTWKSEFDIPEDIIDAVRILNSSLILHAFSNVFQIPKLVPDAYFTGGGLNVTKRGGLLDVHVDGNYHDATGLNRRMNALIYLNHGWQQEWGGCFELYNSDGSKFVKKVEPIFNRLVIFDSHDYSYHGLPEPINFPDDVDRKSILLYYYTKDKRPSSQIKVDEPHSALWVKRGLKDKRGNLKRDFE